ncbi:hypothetical protein Vpro01_01326 [Vibrio proteolyticus]
MIYLVITFLSYLISALSIKNIIGASQNNINIHSINFYTHFLLQGALGAILVVNNLDHHYLISSVTNQQTRFIGWLLITALPLSYTIGIVISNVLITNKISIKSEYSCYLNNKVVIGKDHILLLSLLPIFCLVCFYVFSMSDVFSYKYLVGNHDLAKIRIMADDTYHGNIYVKNILFKTLIPIFAIFSFVVYLNNRKHITLLLCLVYMLMAIYSLTYSLAKSPLAFFLISLFFSYFYSRGSMEIRKLFYFSLLVITVILLSYYFFMGGELLSNSYNKGPIGRVILSQQAGIYLSIDMFPNHIDFIGFESFSKNVSSFFGIAHIDRSAEYLMQFFNKNAVDKGTAGVLNSLFIAESWANWGIYGAVIFPIWVGFITNILILFIISTPKSAFLVSILSYYSFGGAVIGGANDYLYNPKSIIVAILLTLYLVLMYCMSKYVKKNINVS